jgi:cytochrome P450
MTTLPISPYHPTPVPVDAGLPLIGNLIPLSTDVLKHLTDNARRYPEIVAVRVMNGTFYQVTHPDLIEQVLVTHSAHFIKDKGLKVYAKPVFGNGLLSSDGDFWLRQRRMAQPAFHRQRIALYAEAMTEFTARAIATWRDGEVRDIHADMMHLTLEVVAKTLFNAESDAQVAEIGACLDTIMERFNSNGLTSLLEQATGRVINKDLQRRYDAAVSRLNAIVDGVIAERRAALAAGVAPGDDLLAMFLEARDEDGNGMSDEQLRDECKTMFLAGHETTALTLSWTWWLLSLNPQVNAALRDELRRVLNGRAPALADLPELPYTDQVIKEAMRIMPPAWSIQREATADVELVGPSGARYVIPKGRDALLSQYATHHDPRWFPEPERFRPERWTPQFAKTMPKFAYFPFGGGPRLCIGQQFAQMEAALMLATIAQKYDLRLVPGQRIVPEPSITMRPKHGLKMVPVAQALSLRHA